MHKLCISYQGRCSSVALTKLKSYDIIELKQSSILDIKQHWQINKLSQRHISGESALKTNKGAQN